MRNLIRLYFTRQDGSPCTSGLDDFNRMHASGLWGPQSWASTWVNDSGHAVFETSKNYAVAIKEIMGDQHYRFLFSRSIKHPVSSSYD